MIGSQTGQATGTGDVESIGNLIGKTPAPYNPGQNPITGAMGGGVQNSPIKPVVHTIHMETNVNKAPTPGGAGESIGGLMNMGGNNASKVAQISNSVHPQMQPPSMIDHGESIGGLMMAGQNQP